MYTTVKDRGSVYAEGGVYDVPLGTALKFVHYGWAQNPEGFISTPFEDLFEARRIAREAEREEHRRLYGE